ncbi:MAG: LPS export ABC transporter periplasmic protein LptC [Bacteroidales bacterium]|jgi:LPS export ABC transporter protein LptC
MTALLKKYKTIILVIVLGLLFSCENDISTVNIITNKDKSPTETSRNVEIIYSEDADVLVKANAPLLKRYINDKTPYMEMPEGVKVLFYDSLKSVESSLKSNYAIYREKEKIMEARNNVEVINRKGEKLNTEHLIWNEQKEKIYSDVFVKITTNDEILFGEGLESDQYFDKWKIKKPKGTISVKK